MPDVHPTNQPARRVKPRAELEQPMLPARPECETPVVAERAVMLPSRSVKPRELAMTSATTADNDDGHDDGSHHDEVAH